MKLAHTTALTPLMATGDALLAWADGDRAFDLFCEPPTAIVPTEDMAHLRPVIVTPERRIVWGFHYRPVWQESTTTEFPILSIGEGSTSDRRSTITTGLRCALSAENRTGRFRLSELDRVRELLERTGVAESSWSAIAHLLSAETDPWPLIERFRALPAVLADAVDQDLIDLRTAEAIPGDLSMSAGRFLSLVSELSYSNRRQALRMVVELLRGGADVEDLVHELSGISRQEVMPALRRRRYPVLSDLERRFDTVRRGELSGTGVTLTPPNNFEGDRFQVSFTFRNGAELRSRLNATAHLEDKMDELLDLLF